MVGFSEVRNYYKLDYLLSTICPPSNDKFEIKIDKAAVNVLKVASKTLYNEFKVPLRRNFSNSLFLHFLNL